MPRASETLGRRVWTTYSRLLCHGRESNAHPFKIWLRGHSRSL